MFRSLNINKVQKSSLTNSTDFDFLMKSMHREKDKQKENVGAFNWIEQNKKKKISNSLIQKSSVQSNGDYQTLINKISTFIQITLKLLSQQHNSQTLVKQARSLGQYLQSKLTTLSYPVPQNQSKLIQLQKQNQQLQQLIHSHELTNIRMHIRINDQQSSDIETYKQKLSDSYLSYKKLQEKVIGYKSKINQLHNKINILTLQNSKNIKRIQYLQSLLKKKSQQIQYYSNSNNNSINTDQFQSVIDQQNNQLQRMCYSFKQLIQKHEQKEYLWSEEVIQYKNKIRSLEKRIGQREVKSKQMIMDWKDGQDQLWRCVFVQAGVLEKLL